MNALRRRAPILGPILSLAIAGVWPALAAAAPDSFDAHCADIQVLMLKPVQHELGVTEAQRARMNVFADKHRTEVDALKKKLAGVKADPSPQLYEYYMELKTNVLKQLTAAQLRRLREISLQRIGLLALCDPVVAKRVGLTDAQVKRLRTTYDEGFKQYQTVERNALERVLKPYEGIKPKDQAEADALNRKVKPLAEGARKAIQPELDAIKARYDARMRAIMTAGQLSTFEALRGKPFKPA